MPRLVDLQHIPAGSAAPEPEWISADGPTRMLYFAVEPFAGAATKAFAYLATPAPGDGPYPAIVLVHGGGGRAFAGWATMWAQRGYVAMALDLTGCGPDGNPHEFGGPRQDNQANFGALAGGIDQAWMYHAVADVLHAVSLLSALPEVDRDTIGMTGISWGAHVAELAVALDPRVSVAAFVYGCGFTRGNPTWAPALDALPAELADLWIEEFDPLNYMARIDIPTLWITGAKDEFYPLDRFQWTHRLLPGQRTLRVTPDFAHSHEDGWSPIEICEFMNAHLRGSASLPALGQPVQEDDHVHATAYSEMPIIGAQLHYTVDETAWSGRSWLSEPAVMADKAVEATLPVSPLRPSAYFLTIEDSRGVVVSTQYIGVEAGE
jgi:dienelactone hydrolase